ncbi:MAG: hypothetical protein JRJ76_02280 [Deltaproteobacteria bacterium]|nr:hypothetical protein [Deltaproteobacteria bacterium]
MKYQYYQPPDAPPPPKPPPPPPPKPPLPPDHDPPRPPIAEKSKNNINSFGFLINSINKRMITIKDIILLAKLGGFR